MIISVEDIRKYREIAKNTQQNRVEVFIRETEELDIVPMLGVDEYDRLTANRECFILGRSELANTRLGDTLTPQETLLLNGGEYVDKCGCRQRFAGLIAAESYIVYARFIRNHPLQVTPFGVVVKEGDDSSPASAQSINAVSKDSEKIGRQYLADTIKYWRFTQECGCGGCQQPVRASKHKFFAIGD